MDKKGSYLGFIVIVSFSTVLATGLVSDIDNLGLRLAVSVLIGAICGLIGGLILRKKYLNQNTACQKQDLPK